MIPCYQIKTKFIKKCTKKQGQENEEKEMRAACAFFAEFLLFQ